MVGCCLDKFKEDLKAILFNHKDQTNQSYTIDNIIVKLQYVPIVDVYTVECRLIHLSETILMAELTVEEVKTDLFVENVLDSIKSFKKYVMNTLQYFESG